MSVIYNIATGVSPKPEFIPMIRQLCKDDDVDLQACIIVDGPGCCNVAVMLPEPNEQWITQLTIALMPSKYSLYDSDPAIKAGDFEDRRQR